MSTGNNLTKKTSNGTVCDDCPTCRVKACAVLITDTAGMYHAGELIKPSLLAHAHCDLIGLLQVLAKKAWEMNSIKINKVVSDEAN
jgi:hypothetical protein